MFFRKKGSKFSNVKTGKYDSKKESKRAGELQLLLKAGIIKELEEQKVFVLQVVKKGRISKNNKSYCHCTLIDNKIVVLANNNKNDTFIIQDYVF